MSRPVTVSSGSVAVTVRVAAIPAEVTKGAPHARTAGASTGPPPMAWLPRPVGLRPDGTLWQRHRPWPVRTMQPAHRHRSARRRPHVLEHRALPVASTARWIVRCLVGRRVMSGQGRPSEMAIMVISEGTGTSGPYRPVEADFSQASGRREVVPAPRRRRGGRSRVREEPRRTCDAGTVRGRYVAPRTVRSRPARTTPGPRSRPVA